MNDQIHHVIDDKTGKTLHSTFSSYDARNVKLFLGDGCSIKTLKIGGSPEPFISNPK